MAHLAQLWLAGEGHRAAPADWGRACTLTSLQAPRSVYCSQAVARCYLYSSLVPAGVVEVVHSLKAYPSSF